MYRGRFRTYRYSAVPSTTPVVRWLLILNVGIFLLQIAFLDRYIPILGLVPAHLLGRGYLWQIVTYMFLHGSFLHILFNMLFLWMMGSEIERYWGSREFLKYYFVTGCGAGLDSIIAAGMVAPGGEVIGVDMTSEMIDKARQNAALVGVRNVSFKQGLNEEVPVADGWADVVISNGALNLSPSKEKVFCEIYRVLKPGGRMQIADILVQKVIPESAKRNIDLWAG